MTLTKNIKKDNKKVDNNKKVALSKMNEAALISGVRRLACKFSPKVS
jgi:hypothetical protein